MNRILILMIFSALAATGGAKDPANETHYKPLSMETLNPTSNVNISISIAKQSLLDSLNTVIDETLAAEFDLGYDDLEIKTWKTDHASFKLEDKDLYLDLSLKIWARKNIIFADAEATGEIKLVFKTTFDIDSQWNVKSVTQIHHHEWLEKPVIEVGIIKIPAESIANIIIDRTKEEIGSQIDYTLAESLVIDKDVQELYDVITQTRLIDEDNKLWLKVNPIEVKVRKVIEDEDSLRTVVNFISEFQIVSGEEPESLTKKSLPPFKWVNELEQDTEVKLQASVSMDHIRELVRDSLVGREFKRKKRSIIVDSLNIIPKGEELRIESFLSGSLNGKATIKGKPQFDSKSQEIKVSKLGLSLKTGNVFKKIGFWLVKGKVKRQIKREIQYSLKEQMEEARKGILTELNAYNDIEGIKVRTHADEIIIDALYFGEDEITGNLTAKGNIHISILDIRALSNINFEDLR